MKKKLLYLFALLFVGVGQMTAQNWTWTRVTPTSGKSYYLYAEVDGLENRFLNASNGFDASPRILWTIENNFPGDADKSSSFYSLHSSLNTYFAMYNYDWACQVRTDAKDKSGDDIRLASKDTDANGTYTIARYKKCSSSVSKRNVEVTNKGLTSTAQKDPTECWRFISLEEGNAYLSYVNAYSAANAFSGNDKLPSELKTELESVLSANNSSDIITASSKTSALIAIAEKCSHYCSAPLSVSNATTDWTAAQGKKAEKYEGVETYGGNSKDFAVGKVLYQRIEGLVNGIYELEFYSAANAAQWEAGGVTTGPNIAKTYVIADVEQDIDMSVWSRAGGEEIDINDFARKVTVNVTDGTIEYGIKNIGVGGNWYVCKAKSLTYYGPSSVARTTKGTKYGTICMPFDFTTNDATLYTISGINVNGTTIELNKVGTVGAAGVPYIYQASGTESQSFSYKSGDIVAEPKEGANGLVGTFALTAVPQGDFVMQTQDGVQGFYYVDEDNAVYSGSNKCYLKAPSSNLVKSYYFGSDEETAVKAVNALMSGKANIYDLNGRKLDRLQKGVNIVNGKKVIVK